MARAKAKAEPKAEERKRMPFIRESLDDVSEAHPAPEAEYDLRVLKSKQKESKKGNDMIELLIGFDDGTDAPPFFHYLLGWDSDTDEEQVISRKREIKRFCAAFDAPEDFEAGDLTGCTASKIFVKQETSDHDGVTRNRMVLPRLKD